MAEFVPGSHVQYLSPSQEQLDEMELLQAMSNADEFNWTQDPETGDSSMHHCTVAINTRRALGMCTGWDSVSLVIACCSYCR